MKCEQCGVTDLRADNELGVCRKTAACNSERSRRFRGQYRERQAKQATAVAQAIAWALDQAKEVQ
jgi:hypothetical protein